MTVKTTGAQIKSFYADREFWPDDSGATWHEDGQVHADGALIDDITAILDTATVTIAGGVVFGPKWDGNEPSFETYFKRWQKAQTVQAIIVECDKSDLEAVTTAVKAAGGRVVK